VNRDRNKFPWQATSTFLSRQSGIHFQLKVGRNKPDAGLIRVDGTHFFLEAHIIEGLRIRGAATSIHSTKIREDFS
jgi:hypothetical protein